MYICTLKYTIKYPGCGKENPDWNFPCYSMLFRVIPCPAATSKDKSCLYYQRIEKAIYRKQCSCSGMFPDLKSTRDVS